MKGLRRGLLAGLVLLAVAFSSGLIAAWYANVPAAYQAFKLAAYISITTGLSGSLLTLFCGATWLENSER